MKIGYVGGGSLRVIAEVRALALEMAGRLENGEIALFDYDRERVEAVATLLRLAPEAKRAGLRITVSDSLDRTLEGADFVEITARPWSDRYVADGCAAGS